MGGVEADPYGQNALGSDDGQRCAGQALQFVGEQLLGAVGQQQGVVVVATALRVSR